MTIVKRFSRVDCIAQYFETCPHLKKGQIKLDWIADSIVKEGTDARYLPKGGEKKEWRKFDFLLTVEKPIENPLYLSQKIVYWIETSGCLPKLKGEETAVCMEYIRPVEWAQGLGIQCRLLYYKNI